MRSVVEALDVLFEHADLLLLLIEAPRLAISILRLLASNVLFKYLLLTIYVDLINLFVRVVATKMKCEEFATFSEDHDFICVER